ncbi:ABC transporter substrate-binding protein [Hydrogenophaga flava]|uniref:ABC transporter substrate-binding protein n=1 Tax=Hydrogenophaga flava TaxID=65657 RepID=UPI000825EF1D|nr:ABC transporter substrate-binding protein [Hydrogenophaga flava]
MPSLLASLSGRLAAAVATGLLALPVQAQDKVTFLTSWFAQAEHGGYYQAVATGIYKKHNLDVTIKMGGPQVNAVQLLAAGQADFLMGKDFQVLSGIERGIPMVTVAALFQSEPQGIMTHPDIKSLADLKGKSVMIATSAHNTYWPWMKAKFGLTDANAKPYTGSLQPFFADTSTATQGFATSEPFEAEKAGKKVNFFLMADEGYPPYGNTIVTLQKTAKDKPDVVARFVKATIEGWDSYLKDPAPGNALIRQDNPKMEDEKLAFAVKRLREINFMKSGDAARMGPGVMTEARWKKTFDFMVGHGILKPDVDWKQAYTTAFLPKP